MTSDIVVKQDGVEPTVQHVQQDLVVVSGYFPILKITYMN